MQYSGSLGSPPQKRPHAASHLTPRRPAIKPGSPPSAPLFSPSPFFSSHCFCILVPQEAAILCPIRRLDSARASLRSSAPAVGRSLRGSSFGGCESELDSVSSRTNLVFFGIDLACGRPSRRFSWVSALFSPICWWIWCSRPVKFGSCAQVAALGTLKLGILCGLAAVLGFRVTRAQPTEEASQGCLWEELFHFWGFQWTRLRD